MTENVNIIEAKLSWLGFGFFPRFGTLPYSLFRAGYRANNDHQMYNEDFVVDEVNENRFLDEESLQMLGWVCSTQILSYNI